MTLPVNSVSKSNLQYNREAENVCGLTRSGHILVGADDESGATGGADSAPEDFRRRPKQIGGFLGAMHSRMKRTDQTVIADLEGETTVDETASAANANIGLSRIYHQICLDR